MSDPADPADPTDPDGDGIPEDSPAEGVLDDDEADPAEPNEPA